MGRTRRDEISRTLPARRCLICSILKKSGTSGLPLRDQIHQESDRDQAETDATGGGDPAGEQQLQCVSRGQDLVVVVDVDTLRLLDGLPYRFLSAFRACAAN